MRALENFCFPLVRKFYVASYCCKYGMHIANFQLERFECFWRANMGSAFSFNINYKFMYSKNFQQLWKLRMFNLITLTHVHWWSQQPGKRFHSILRWLHNWPTLLIGSYRLDLKRMLAFHCTYHKPIQWV